MGPTVPFDPAALSVWQLPQPALVNTLAPAAFGFGPDGVPEACF